MSYGNYVSVFWVAAALFFVTYESVKGAIGVVGLSSQFSLASLVAASCCGETVCKVSILFVLII